LIAPHRAATLHTMRRQRGRTTSVDEYTRQGWTQHPCTQCRGTGLAYAHRNDDPKMPIIGHERCRSCAGRGGWWRSPQGMRCSYPGGPWLAG